MSTASVSGERRALLSLLRGGSSRRLLRCPGAARRLSAPVRGGIVRCRRRPLRRSRSPCPGIAVGSQEQARTFSAARRSVPALLPSRCPAACVRMPIEDTRRPTTVAPCTPFHSRLRFASASAPPTRGSSAEPASKTARRTAFANLTDEDVLALPARARQAQNVVDSRHVEGTTKPPRAAVPIWRVSRLSGPLD